jgi:serine/threonine protein kinase/Tol biopolymer transport system component
MTALADPRAVMDLATGTRLGPYELIARIGAGGMGHVYRARDSRLQRDVAVKLLPDVFARDPERLARFRREAQVLASLNHPHICAIYGVEEWEGIPALILELLDGDTLADRIQRGPLSLDDAVWMGRQILAALGVAHDTGIIHRDLKPANIAVAPDGHVKVLDFGLARVLPGDAAGSGGSTLAGISVEGAMLGTVAYMSPEQARGQPVERSADVWAFGCVFYEMLTGVPVFAGGTAGEVLECVFGRDPDWTRLPPSTPDAIRRLLRRCLEKNPQQRLRDVRDAALEFDDLDVLPTDRQGIAQRGRAGAWTIALGIATLALLASISTDVVVRLLHVPPAPPETRFQISLSSPDNLRDEGLLAAVSPDGLHIVFAASSGGEAMLWLRTLSTVSARPLAGTERAALPFWSPDSRSIGFFADAELKRVDLDGGSLQTLAPAPAGAGGSWGRDGTIIFSPNPGRPIARVAASMPGEVTSVTPFDGSQQASHEYPQFLPDSRHFIYYVTGRSEAAGVYAGQIDDMTTRRLVDADGPAVVTSTAHLLFLRQGTIFAQAFDQSRLALSGTTFPLAEQVPRGTRLSTSPAGPIVYRTPAAGSGEQQFVWVGRTGRETDKVVYPNTGGLGASLSRDGHSVATLKYVSGNMDVWSFDTGRRVWNRITADPLDDIFPVWSPDGSRVVFGSNRIPGGIQNLYIKGVGGPPGSEALLLASPKIKFATDWSADGNVLLFDQVDRQKGSIEIWGLRLGSDSEPFPVVHTTFKDQAGQFSPDGTWIAYQSDRDGRSEIYVQPFSGPGASVLVSSGGGTQARWNPNGKELFYVGLDGEMMSVPMRAGSNEHQLVPGAATPLFATKLRPSRRQNYMVSPDGQSFVINSVVEPTTSSSLTVILNWKARPYVP